MLSKLVMGGGLLVVMIALAGGAEAGCSCCGDGEGTEDCPAWIEAVLGGSSVEAEADAGIGAEEEIGAEVATKAETEGDEDISSWSISASKLRQRIEGGSELTIAYVSNTPPQGWSYLQGSILLPSRCLVQADGSLKPVSDLSDVIGNAGISEDDDLVVYGDCFSCGDATFVFWAMKYLGHKDVQILRGSPEDWALAGLPRAATAAAMPAATYSPDLSPQLLADYEAVASGELVVVDARVPDQFAKDHIEGAVNIDYNRVIDGGWIKVDSALAEIFSDLDPERPVAVYTKNGGQASIVWYALMLQGYDAGLYTWRDWLGHQS